jgi:hypothetical protein
MQISTSVTIEELMCGDKAAEADVTITFDVMPEEKPTRDYPGYPATVELTGWSITHYTLYGNDGTPIMEGPQATTPKWVKAEVDKYVTENEDYLSELACESCEE